MEIMALKVGLKVLENYGHMQVIVETDSSQCVSLFNGHPYMEHPEVENILECKQIHARI